METITLVDLVNLFVEEKKELSSKEVDVLNELITFAVLQRAKLEGVYK